MAVELDQLFRRNGIGQTSRVDFRGKQGFIGVDIPQPGQKRLIEQSRFDHPSGLLEQRDKIVG